ncbi:MAG: hypothetical protein JWN28_693, partial [Candidatus Saccharibacteria bacterium]|nr:hypothetical protein [Candidatus Saccharibacteria bacterium]
MAEHVPSRRETLKQSRVPTPILILGFIF